MTHAAGLDSVDGGAERLRRVAGLAVDRDLSGTAQNLAEDRHLNTSALPRKRGSRPLS